MIDLRTVKEMWVGNKFVRQVYLGNVLIKDFSPVEVELPDPDPVDPPTDPETPPVTPPNELGLKDHYPWPIGQTLKDNYAARAIEYTKGVLDDSDRLGAENAFKMGALQPTIGNFQWTAADKVCNFALANGKDLFIHALCWANVAPTDLRAKKGVWTTAQFETHLRTHIRTVMLHLQPWWGIIKGVDVINEALTPNNPRTGADPKSTTGYAFWADVLPDYIAIAFDEFKSIPHGIPGFINDFTFEQSPAKCATVLKLISDLAARGIVIDGIGSQNHAPVGVSRSAIKARYKTLSSSGKLIHISELDIKFKGGVKTSNGWPTDIPGWTTTDKTSAIENSILKQRPDILQLTTDIYTFYYSMYAEVVPPSQRFGITTWGLSDRDSHLNYPEYTDFPTIRYYDYSPKPARQALMNMAIPNYVP